MSTISKAISQKVAGEAVELAFMARAAALGLTVSRPHGDSASYDVIVGDDVRLLRVQVKSVSVRDRERYRITASFGGRCKRPYSPATIDFIAAWIRPLDLWYIIPSARLNSKVSLSLYPDRPGRGHFEDCRERWNLLTDVVQEVSGVPLRSSRPLRPLRSQSPSVGDSGLCSVRLESCGLGSATGNGEGATGNALSVFNSELIACQRCPRLVAYREQIGREKRRAFLDWDYWSRPVPGFGDPAARVLLLGLAPGAHGSNRTGRMFTGDASGRFLFDVLHASGFASQPTGTHRDDGLQLTDCYITAAVRCVPPENKPLPDEIANCAQFLDRELALLKNVRVVIALGRIGFDAYLNYLKRRGVLKSKGGYVFGHGRHYDMPDGRVLLASYHPSNQNTQTGKLTREMFLQIFRTARHLAEGPCG
jgi:uracil-DNA glycosylase family 4